MKQTFLQPVVRICVLVLLLNFASNIFSPTAYALSPSALSKEQEQELFRLFEEGKQAFDKGDYAGAERVWQAGLDKAQAFRDDFWIARYLNLLGLIFASQNQYEKALEYYTRSLDMRLKLGDEKAIAATLLNIGNIYTNLSQYEKAREYYTRSLDIHRKQNDPEDLTLSLNNLGVINYKLGDYEKALDYHARALELRQKSGNQRAIAQSFNNLGVIHSSLGQYEKALEYHHQALDIRQQLGNLEDLTQSLNNLAIVYLKRGEYEQALDYHNRSLDLRQERGQPKDIAVSLNNIGNVFNSLGQYDKALEYYHRALDIHQKLGNPEDIAVCLNNIGCVYVGLDQYAQALDCHTRALDLRQKLGVPEGIAESLHNLGMTYSSLGQEVKAIECYMRALEIRLKLGAQAEIANNLNNLAHLHYRLQQFEKALEYCLRALEIRELVGNRRDIAQSLYNLGKIYMSLGRAEEAQAAFDRALQLFEAVGEQVADPTQIGAFQEAHQGELYPRYALLLATRNRLPEALAMADRGRARGLALQVAQTRADITHFSAEDARLWQAGIEELTRADRLLHAAQQRLEQAVSQEKADATSQRDKARERYEAAERHLTVLRTKLYQRYPSFRRLSGAEPLTPAQLKKLTQRNPDTLYLHFNIVGDDTTLLFTLSHRDGLKHFLLPGRKRLIQRTQEWRATLTAPAALQSPETPLTQKQELMQLTKVEPQHAHALFRELLLPLEKGGMLKPGRYQRLVIVPDGPLHTVPFAALMDGNGKRLIDRFAISTSISLGLLIWPIHHRRPANGLLVVTDPAGGEGERFVKNEGATRRSALMGNFTPTPLRYTRDGAKQVAQMFPDALGLAGPQAQEAMVKKEMGRYALLLFATHGVLDPANGLRSWLLMAKPEDSTEDGRLEASEIINVPLSAQLAVLIACETGLGRRLGGDMQGLVWAFWAAGCPSVVASQWKVDEAPTKQLMVAFHRSLKAGQRKDSALRAAMREVRKDARYAHPFYWAAFQVYGDTSRWSVLHTSSKH